ncbi:MAG: single-stranded-DNA-specific exonuclease RecJ [Flavobacteriaceae bacterium]|nr:single-stranded-DNA-specific exonuclease RecJ [Flavobacteriaceae bacterium]
MRWEAISEPEQSFVQQLQKELGVSSIIAALLVQRGMHTFGAARAFFRPQWQDLHSPFLMRDMDKAVARIHAALEEDQAIMVYGDYDVDGTTSVALMSSFLNEKTKKITPYIPDRYTEGYGISFKGIDVAVEKGIQLIIALDCGIKAVDKVAYAKKKGIDFIICDHHLPGEELPQATALLDPKRSDCDYPFDELCGCGIGFKLIQALSESWDEPEEKLFPYLDLVATAIAADIVPMEGENRTLCFFGLAQLHQNPRPGIQSLLGSLKKPVNITDLVFKVAPRINAAGRMDHALVAVDLLTSKDYNEVKKLVEAIEQFNTERRATDERITQEALNQIKQRKEEDFPATVVFAADWHKGVVGIVASRLIENHYRPTVVLTQSGENYVGSVRSVKGFNIYNALDACKAHMLQFGGHKYAAGLTLHKDQLTTFKAAFEKQVETTILPEQKTPVLLYDLVLPIEEVNHKLYRIVAQMAPFGPKNMRPVFCSTNCVDSGQSKVVGKDQSHLRLSVQTANGPLVGIGFGMANHFEHIKSGAAFDLLYTLDENEWNGTISLQLKLKAIRPKE